MGDSKLMALPMNNDFVPYDDSSERANSVEDYKVTCIEFIKDISGSYLESVSYTLLTLPTTPYV